MAKPEVITMSMRELDRLKTIQAVIDGRLSQTLAAERLGLSSRQLRRLVQRYAIDGPIGLISKLRGRPSNRQLGFGKAELALSLIRQHYADFGPTLACEKLQERHGLQIGTETVRALMTATGMWVPRKHRPPKVHQPRSRRQCAGELIQIDGSDHRWFEERAPACTILVYVDDATSRIMELLFTESESTFSYFRATRSYLERHGKPQAFYSDKASVFRVNAKSARAGDGYTQFGRALYELNIEGICANSSQAKGRVERAHLTLQDRLVKELRLRGISCMADANAFMPAFLSDYNRRFSKPPKVEHDTHRPVRSDEDLDLIMCWHETRCVSNALTIQYDKVMYLLPDVPAHRSLAGHYIDVYHYDDGRVEPRWNGAPLPFTIFDKVTDIDQGAVVDNKRLSHVLEMARLVQAQREGRTTRSVPAPLGELRKRGQPKGRKPQSGLDQADIAKTLILLKNRKKKTEIEVKTGSKQRNPVILKPDISI